MPQQEFKEAVENYARQKAEFARIIQRRYLNNEITAAVAMDKIASLNDLADLQDPWGDEFTASLAWVYDQLSAALDLVFVDVPAKLRNVFFEAGKFVFKIVETGGQVVEITARWGMIALGVAVLIVVGLIIAIANSALAKNVKVVAPVPV
jgi:hypothetical protein